MPAAVYQLFVRLEVLNAASNKIKAIDPDIQHFAQLKVRRTSASQPRPSNGAPCSRPPAVPLRLGPQELDMSDNLLSAIPPELGEAKSLRRLLLGSNRLQMLSPASTSDGDGGCAACRGRS